MNKRNEHHIHDKSRSTLRESARKHFLKEHKDQEHELHDNHTRIIKLLHDGYEFVGSTREANHYEVHFRHTLHQKQQDVWFNFEVNFKHCESLWALK